MGAKDISKTMTLKDGVSGALRKINAGTVQYKKNLQELKRTGDQTWSSLKGGAASVKSQFVGMAAAALGTAGVMSSISFGLGAAKDLESYRLTLNTVMKDTEKAGNLMKWASNFANITPFDTKAVVEGTVRLQSYGINAQATMGSIGDMASVMNKDLMQAIEAVADAQTGELERMKEFGIQKADIQKKSDEMFKKQTTVNNKGQIVNQQQFNQALFALMDERFKGGMIKQASTFKGLMSNITGTWQTGLANMVGVGADGVVRTGSLFASLKKDAAEAANALGRMANDGTFVRWGDNLKRIYDTGKGVFNFFRTSWPTIGPIVYGAAASFVAYKTAAMGAATWTALFGQKATFAAMKTAVLGTVSSVAARQIGPLTGAMRLFNAAVGANPIGTAVVVIGLAVTAYQLLKGHMESVELKGMQVWNTMVGAAEWGVNAYIKYANFMLGVYKFAWDSIEYAGKSIWNGILTAAAAGINGFNGLIEKMVNAALGGVNTIIRGANKASEALGFGKVVKELTFSGLAKVDFSGAQSVADKPKWDSGFSPIGQVDLGGAKFGEDSIAKQTQKAKAESDKRNGKAAQDDLTGAVKSLSDSVAQNTAATNQNTTATNGNTKAVLKDNKGPMDLADSLLNRIERHLYAT